MLKMFTESYSRRLKVLKKVKKIFSKFFRFLVYDHLKTLERKTLGAFPFLTRYRKRRLLKIFN